jgi:hypothetical protein
MFLTPPRCLSFRTPAQPLLRISTPRRPLCGGSHNCPHPLGLRIACTPPCGSLPAHIAFWLGRRLCARTETGCAAPPPPRLRLSSWAVDGASTRAFCRLSPPMLSSCLCARRRREALPVPPPCIRRQRSTGRRWLNRRLDRGRLDPMSLLKEMILPPQNVSLSKLFQCKRAGKKQRSIRSSQHRTAFTDHTRACRGMVSTLNLRTIALREMR